MKKKVVEKSEVEAEEVKDKKTEQKAKAKKRKSAKKQDKMARWSGAILFVIILFVGFLLWVAGEVSSEGGRKAPVERSGVQTTPTAPQVGGQGRVVIE